MGKKRINQLLDQLQANHTADLKNAAAVFTVAQVAVNQLEQQLQPEPGAIASLPPSAPESKETLRQRYGSFNACRAAARQKGIHFKKTPSWEQLSEAFCYFETLQALIDDHLANQPTSKLPELAMTFTMKPPQRKKSHSKTPLDP